MTLRARSKDALRLALDLISGVTARLPHAPRARILNYHEVLEGTARCPNPYNQVSAGMLRDHLSRLKDAGYEIMTVGEQARRLADRPPRLGRVISLSFDDGLAEHHDIVLPILGRLGLSATFYVVTSRVGQPAAMGRPGARHLGRDQVRALHDAGMEIGSHSRTHRVLSRLGPEEIRDEVSGSHDDVVSMTGAPPLGFAYPYGSRATYHAGVVDAVRHAGYTSAVSTGIGANDATTPLFELLRIPVYGTDSGTRVLARACGADDWTGAAQEAWLRLFPHHSTRGTS